jgi:hypothetical protein
MQRETIEKLCNMYCICNPTYMYYLLIKVRHQSSPITFKKRIYSLLLISIYGIKFVKDHLLYESQANSDFSPQSLRVIMDRMGKNNVLKYIYLNFFCKKETLQVFCGICVLNLFVGIFLRKTF